MFTNFLETNYSSDLKSERPKQQTMSDKTPLKISEKLEKISLLDFRNNQD